MDYSLFDYAPIHTHTARIRENVHIVKGNIINEIKNETWRLKHSVQVDAYVSVCVTNASSNLSS